MFIKRLEDFKMLAAIIYEWHRSKYFFYFFLLVSNFKNFCNNYVTFVK